MRTDGGGDDAIWSWSGYAVALQGPNADPAKVDGISVDSVMQKRSPRPSAPVLCRGVAGESLKSRAESWLQRRSSCDGEEEGGRLGDFPAL